MVDRSALKVNQVGIIALVVLAYLLAWPWLVGLVAAVLLIGTIFPGAALFKQFYARVLRPAGLVRPDPVPDDPRPHQFAQGLGGLVLAVGFGLLVSGVTALGWALAWLVVVLAAVNLLFNFCAGCFLYYQIGRLGLRRLVGG